MTSKIYHRPILLVEDDPLLGATMRRYLEKMSGDVRCAETGSEAAAIWRDMPPGLVLMDYRLPDGKGTDVVARLRSEGRSDPVVCLTGESEELTAEVQAQLAIRSVLGKPVMLDDLREILSALSDLVDEPASTETDTRRVRRLGKYRRIVWRGRISGSRVARLCRAANDELWVAVELPEVLQSESAGWRGFCAWAGWLSSRGGRLCLLVESETDQASVEGEVGNYLDVVADPEALLFQGTRLTSAAERRQLLGALHTQFDQEAADV